MKNSGFRGRTLAAAPIMSLSVALMLGACSSPEESTDAGGGTAEGATVTNCGAEKTYPADPSMLAYDSGIISIALAAGAADNLDSVASIGADRDVLAAKHGADVVDGLEVISDKAPTLEQIVAEQPDVYFAGWNYGMSESRGVTPDLLDQRGVGTYLLTESCRQEGTTQRGVVEPWEALETDLRNIGEMTGNADEAEAVIEDHRKRLGELDSAPRADEDPTVFVFDSGTDAIFTSGKFGAPQAIIEAAGARNHTEDIADTWVEVGWETLTAQAPDAFVFVDYDGQTFADKVEVLKSHPATRDLPAVKDDRFVNLPYAMWVSSPLNIDAAEHLRRALEGFDLVPESGIDPAIDLPASVDGQEHHAR
ncbi:ABC transporter substrate-binding protein [uncultured Corynebacterium sp.]|uniref:ABC transporter substrate-binding protein n=1 Tax=uncultured Corynebacterium sp. TaxID=159447 RepID=UPI0025EED804|nr:ABC transporter substrate-binding protein [uncultured Corynebacterium sp.]